MLMLVMNIKKWSIFSHYLLAIAFPSVWYYFYCCCCFWILFSVGKKEKNKIWHLCQTCIHCRRRRHCSMGKYWNKLFLFFLVTNEIPFFPLFHSYIQNVYVVNLSVHYSTVYFRRLLFSFFFGWCSFASP